MKPYALIIDHEACWGCRTCEIACKQENQVPEGVSLISVMEKGPKTVEGRLDFVFKINLCRHCDDPPCMEVCPVEAITKRDDGIVVLDTEECTGCRLCMEECPYDAISFDEKRGIAHKCNFCYQRVDHGLIPACADNICLGHCIYFGPPEEIKNLIAEKHKNWSKGETR